ncbi:MFS transporter [Microbacterium gorillae]|uniref:MFS transporter n=1 Tax=Microbacterium gorillae TaxID=1231063 RepID=UPI00058FC85D|nr:MFS transporter [Microbacterium gorillae]
MAGYKELLRTSGVARIIIAQLVARFPNGMTSLAILMHVEQMTGSYGQAGLVLAATSIGQAISGPVTSRWMGRWGIRPVLTLTTLICAAAIAGIALGPSVLGLYMALGAIAGLSSPPVQSAVRTIYPKMVNSTKLTPLFSLDASLQEIIWIVAPVLITLVATSISTVVGLLLIVAILLGGGAFFILLPEVGRVRIPRSRRAFGKVLARPAVLLATVVGFLLVGACAAVETGVIATFGHGGLEAGLVLAVFSVGSLAGGLVSGSIPIGPWAMARRLIIVTVGLAVTPFLVNALWGGQAIAIGTALTIAGIGVAPALAVLFAMTTASVKFSDTAEAFGWVGTGQLIGSAAGSAVAGFLIDGIGPQGAYIAAASFAAVGAIVSIVFVRGFPDLRYRDPSPLPDTGVIQTVL